MWQNFKEIYGVPTTQFLGPSLIDGPIVLGSILGAFEQFYLYKKYFCRVFIINKFQVLFLGQKQKLMLIMIMIRCDFLNLILIIFVV